MITKIGKIEEKILEILKRDSQTNTELSLRIYNLANVTNRTRISQACKLLMNKKLIKKDLKHYIFVKDLDTVSEIRGDSQKIISVPTRRSTKDWKKGDKIKLINMDRK